MNYESELNDLFLSQLVSMYEIEKEVVYHYFYLRFLIENIDCKIEKFTKNKKIVDFLLQELNIPTYENEIIYKGEKIKKIYGIENSIENIIVDWEFQSSLHEVINSKGIVLSYEEFIEKEWQQLLRYGRNKAKNHKGKHYYQSYLKWNALELLNKHYKANPKSATFIKGIKYPDNHNYFKRTLEEKYYADIHSVEFITTNTNTITESDLEDYLIRNLHVIEEGLRYIDRQYSIHDGRIDILAKDKNGEYVILELKVQDDKELIWQSMFYPIQFKKQHNVKHVRMITIAPKYPKHILVPLKEIKGIEIMVFKPLIELGKIKQINVSKIS